MSPEWIVTPAAVAGALGTYVLHHDYGFGAVRSSAVSTLVFIGATSSLHHPGVPMWQAAFFGASFTGMCASERFTRRKVVLCGLVFSLIYLAVLRSPAIVRAPGGVLGTSAFLAGLVVVTGEALRVRFARVRLMLRK